MKPLALRIGALVLALGALSFVVVHAGLAGSCARSSGSNVSAKPGVDGQVPSAATDAGAPAFRFLPATKIGPAVLPSDLRILPATKAAPVFLPARRPATQTVPPPDPSPQAPAQQEARP